MASKICNNVLAGRQKDQDKLLAYHSKHFPETNGKIKKEKH